MINNIELRFSLLFLDQSQKQECQKMIIRKKSHNIRKHLRFPISVNWIQFSIHLVLFIQYPPDEGLFLLNIFYPENHEVDLWQVCLLAQHKRFTDTFKGVAWGEGGGVYFGQTAHWTKRSIIFSLSISLKPRSSQNPSKKRSSAS